MKTLRKNIHFITNISIYTVTNILRFYEDLFCTYLKVCFVFMFNSHYAYIPPYMNKTLPTLGNEKEQQPIKFYEKLSGKLIFSRATKSLKMFYFTGLTGRVLKK